MTEKIKLFTLPNLITCLNLLSGCVGVVLAFGGNQTAAMLCLLLAAVFDFFDGFTARLLKAYSPVGVQLDSLADMVSFGFLPAAMLLQVVQGWAMWAVLFNLPYVVVAAVVCTPFLLTVFSALRLAKFNVDDRQTTSFIGLPTPANALFFSSLTIYADRLSPWMIFVPIGVFSFLLVSEIPMFSLKLKDFTVKRYAFQLLLLLLSAAMLVASVVLPGNMLSNVLAAFAPIVLLYILLSVVKWLVKL